jgi:hypothetical protein
MVGRCINELRRTADLTRPTHFTSQSQAGIVDASSQRPNVPGQSYKAVACGLSAPSEWPLVKVVCQILNDDVARLACAPIYIEDEAEASGTWRSHIFYLHVVFTLHHLHLPHIRTRKTDKPNSSHLVRTRFTPDLLLPCSSLSATPQSYRRQNGIRNRNFEAPSASSQAA